MNDLHQVRLGGHHRLDGLVGGRSFVDYVGIFPALYTCCHAHVVLNREATLGFAARHSTTGAVAAAHEAFHVSFAADDIGTRSHASRNDTHISFTGTHCAFACNQNVLAEVTFTRNVIVVTVDRFQFGDERAHFPRAAYCGDNLLHHQMAIPACKILSPFDGFDIVIKVLRSFR